MINVAREENEPYLERIRSLNLSDTTLWQLGVILKDSEILHHFQQQNLEEPETPPLTLAILRGDLTQLETLHQQGADLSDSILFAAAAGQTEIVRYLHEHRFDIRKAIPIATLAGQVEILRYLFTHGIDIKEALSWAILKGQPAIIKYLHESNLIADALSQESHSRLQLMTQEILNSDPIYRPSEFWQVLGGSQKAHLTFGGEANFKRSINQSYCNFIPNSLEDPLITHLESDLFNVKGSAIYSLEDPDNVPGLWTSFYPQYQVFQGDRELQKKCYLQFVSKIYEYALTTTNSPILNQLEEPELGNPIRIYRNGKRISQDLVTSVMEYTTIIQYLKTKQDIPDAPHIIGELGAGYGRLAYVFLKTTQCRYRIFDIPPALHISEWYLSNLFPEKRIFKFRHFKHYTEIEKELEMADLAFFTPNQLTLFPPNYFDAFATISSLHEMSREQIKHFIALMSVTTKDFLYIKQYWKYLNPHDNLCITDSEYALPEPFSISEKKQDLLNPLFFEMIATRKSATLSILLCNYNHAHYLPDSLSAICEQTVPATEIIVLDDGSTDNSVEVIESFCKHHSNIVLLRNPENKGLLYSINKALKAAKGEFIVWTAADDKLLPNFIERSLHCIATYPHAALCFSNLAIFKDGTNSIRTFTKENQGSSFDFGEKMHYLTPKDLIARLQRSYVSLSGNNILARREAILKMGGFLENLRWHSDWFSFYSIALRYGTCVLPETLAAMRERPNTYSRHGMNNPKEQFKVLEAILKTIYEPKNQDLLNAFLKCPTLLSPFGEPMLRVFINRPRYWKLFLPYLKWYCFRHQKYHIRLYGIIARLIRKVFPKKNT